MTSQELDRYSKIPTTKAKGYKDNIVKQKMSIHYRK